MKAYADAAAALMKPNHEYRTYSHAGFPKGSYALPNPTHFHIVRHNQTAVRMRPVLVKLGTHGHPTHYTFNTSCTLKRSPQRPMVTINIGDTRAITLNISMQTIREFIYPFASALNLANIHSFHNMASQTSFNKENYDTNDDTTDSSSQIVNITELCFKNNILMPKETANRQEKNVMKETDEDDVISEYEMKIMQNLHENLVQDISYEKETLEEDANFYDALNTTSQSNVASEMQNLAEKLIEDAMNISGNYDLLKETVHDALLILKQLPFNGVDDQEILENVTNESLASYSSGESGDKVDYNENYSDMFDLNNDENNAEIFELNNEGEMCDLRSSVDEGINVSVSLDESNLNNNESWLPEEFDEKTIEMAEAIYDYLVQQCFEVEELILFPEILYDENINKLFLKLQMLYSQHCSNSFSDEKKNVLRLNVATSVMNKLEIDEALVGKDVDTTDSSDNSNFVSDKIFTISEFVSDILDNFFSRYIGSNSSQSEQTSRWKSVDVFSEFSQDLEQNAAVSHSTPELKVSSDSGKHSLLKRKLKGGSGSSNQDNYNEEVTTFKTKESKNSCSEKYWIAITKSPKKSSSPEREVVDDDLNRSSWSVSKSSLSPIPEEPISVLFPTDMTYSSDEDDILEFSNVEEKSNDNCGEDEQIDILAGGDTSYIPAYVHFENPEINVVVCNSVTFYRTNTINSVSYVQASEVNFVSHDNNANSGNSTYTLSSYCEDSRTNNNYEMGSSESDSDGNWLGYEGAKF